jgi:hypothetical protein
MVAASIICTSAGAASSPPSSPKRLHGDRVERLEEHAAAGTRRPPARLAQLGHNDVLDSDVEDVAVDLRRFGLDVDAGVKDVGGVGLSERLVLESGDELEKDLELDDDKELVERLATRIVGVAHNAKRGDFSAIEERKRIDTLV